MAVTAADSLAIPPEVVEELRIAVLEEIRIAAERLRLLVSDTGSDASDRAADVAAKHVSLHEVTRLIEERSLLQPLVGWPGTPVEELYIESEHRNLALTVLAQHRERQVEHLMSSPVVVDEDKPRLIARVRMLTSFLHEAGVNIQPAFVGG